METVQKNLETAIAKAAKIIRDGGLVAFPTETVYGLGANALNPVAVAKIFELKERPSFDPLIVHIASFEQLVDLVENVSDTVKLLADKFWPGPLTFVLPKTNKVPEIVTSGLATVGVRMPDNPIALELIRKAGCPIAAPSANKFGRISPTKAMHVKKQLPNVDFIIDGGKTSVGIESTIVFVDGDTCTLLRAGKITIDDIRETLPQNFKVIQHTSGEAISPGLLKSHYSPTKALHILNPQTETLPAGSGLIVHEQNHILEVFAHKTIVTSPDMDFHQVAANLFSALHTMEDDPNIHQIFIQPVEETGLGLALMDRINKAAHQYQK
jgi:L-threonylcarbamoyladenylate synthase